ncbi:MAG: hypothetical protein A3C35_05155 [Omnitrophica bacterium RIFCSPHIGHO2_02_FULL_46_11]|nr:MAG: hypothetical protein A3C35_05155 [Omnitrophica bacterium RIFCSPHIGHO2_02_FULL_46_11]OGW86915.1 MAG: hypothetical protein A3A81_00185 [Omnitrophica bacterium RIFCSPLOWO2_01_FULL_45_10b]
MINKISAFIVDDETPARNELKRFLELEKDFKILGEAQDGAEAVSAITDLKPSVIFLDIHMPKMSGLDVARELYLLETPPLIVFVTAYDRYAIQAFEVNAIDYLLKPFDRERFARTCAKIRDALSNQRLLREKAKSLGNYLEEDRRLRITGRKRNSKEKILIHIRDVLYFHVKLTEVIAHLVHDEEYFVSTTLKSLVSTLDPEHFQQTHRAYIVNLDHVEKVVPLFAGNFNLVLKNAAKTSLPLSRRYAKKFKQFLK